MKWSAWLAWSIVLLICIGLPVLRARQSKQAVEDTPSQDVDIPTRMMGRYIVGMNHLLPGKAGGALTDIEEQKNPTESQRIAMAIVAGEVIGRSSAEERLTKINTPTAREYLSIYQTPPQPTDLSDQQERFGWFNDLARSFGKPDTDPLRAHVLHDAKTTIVTVFVAAAVLFGGAGLGLILFVIAIVLISAGKIQFTYLQPTGRSNTYIEAFAIYLAGFILIGLALGKAWPAAPLWMHIVVMFCPIVIAFYWPMLRGGIWSHQRRDWGVHTGKGIVIEALCGVAGYLAGLPIIAAGIGITVLLMKKSGATATHPIMQDLDMSPWLLLGIASVFAPLTEELLFRGALVSHLRSGVGIVLAAVISGLIFASVHPQGWAAIPALASIGIVLALIRQWRGSLVPSMVAHAIHNGVLLTVAILALH